MGILLPERQEPEALTSHGEYAMPFVEAANDLANRRLNMDWVMKFVMGGWIPEGKRTQWTAFAAAVSALAVAFVQWGSGEMTAQMLVEMVADKWEILLGSLIAYFVGEKVDAMREETK